MHSEVLLRTLFDQQGLFGLQYEDFSTIKRKFIVNLRVKMLFLPKRIPKKWLSITKQNNNQIAEKVNLQVELLQY